MIKCPKCDSTIYKEYLNDGKAKLCCVNKFCDWESFSEDKHAFPETQTLSEIKMEWR